MFENHICGRILIDTYSTDLRMLLKPAPTVPRILFSSIPILLRFSIYMHKMFSNKEINKCLTSIGLKIHPTKLTSRDFCKFFTFLTTFSSLFTTTESAMIKTRVTNRSTAIATTFPISWIAFLARSVLRPWSLWLTKVVIYEVKNNKAPCYRPLENGRKANWDVQKLS